VVVFYVKEKTLAKDITQEVFIKAIHSIRVGRYGEEGKFLP
jgi:RNA polymerase sigma-70 factor (ECF subfamily)